MKEAWKVAQQLWEESSEELQMQFQSGGKDTVSTTSSCFPPSLTDAHRETSDQEWNTQELRGCVAH